MTVLYGALAGVIAGIIVSPLILLAAGWALHKAEDWWRRRRMA